MLKKFALVIVTMLSIVRAEAYIVSGTCLVGAFIVGNEFKKEYSKSNQEISKQASKSWKSSQYLFKRWAKNDNKTTMDSHWNSFKRDSQELVKTSGPLFIKGIATVALLGIGVKYFLKDIK